MANSHVSNHSLSEKVISDNLQQPNNIIASGSGIQLGMHTDNWRVLSGSFGQAVDSAVENKLKFIEFGITDGQNFIQGRHIS